MLESVKYYSAETKIAYHEYRAIPVKTLVVNLQNIHRVLSTRDGFKETRYLLNHSNPPSLWEYVHAHWEDFEQEICRDLGLKRSEVAMLSTGVDMDNLSVNTCGYEEFQVTAIATAGVETNALRAGLDKSASVERDGQFTKLGTINLIILTNAALTDSAMARSIITATEAKSAALADLKVESSFTPGVIATGTGTDNLIIVKGAGPQVKYTGGHAKMGELLADAAYLSVTRAIGNSRRRTTKGQWV